MRWNWQCSDSATHLQDLFKIGTTYSLELLTGSRYHKRRDFVIIFCLSHSSILLLCLLCVGILDFLVWGFWCFRFMGAVFLVFWISGMLAVWYLGYLDCVFGYWGFLFLFLHVGLQLFLIPGMFGFWHLFGLWYFVFWYLGFLVF